MSLELIIKSLLEETSSVETHLTNTAIEELGLVILEGLSNDDWDESLNMDDLSAICDDLCESAEYLDACEFIEHNVLSAKNRLFHEITTNNDFYKMQNKLNALFEQEKVPNRGFVYIAFSERPKEYWYVGKASSSNRMNLKSHPKLVHAINHAKKLGLIFPGQSNDKTISNVEAALIKMIEHVTGELPKLNDKSECIDGSYSSDRLENLSRIFLKISNMLQPYQSK